MAYVQLNENQNELPNKPSRLSSTEHNKSTDAKEQRIFIYKYVHSILTITITESNNSLTCDFKLEYQIGENKVINYTTTANLYNLNGLAYNILSNEPHNIKLCTVKDKREYKLNKFAEGAGNIGWQGLPYPEIAQIKFKTNTCYANTENVQIHGVDEISVKFMLKLTTDL